MQTLDIAKSVHTCGSIARSLGCDRRTAQAWIDRLNLKPVAELEGSPVYEESAVVQIRKARETGRPIELPMSKAEAIAYLNDFDRILEHAARDAAAPIDHEEDDVMSALEFYRDWTISRDPLQARRARAARTFSDNWLNRNGVNRNDVSKHFAKLRRPAIEGAKSQAIFENRYKLDEAFKTLLNEFYKGLGLSFIGPCSNTPWLDSFEHATFQVNSLPDEAFKEQREDEPEPQEDEQPIPPPPTGA
jgi:hypothetical protein